ncbi:MAG: hypothetical protein H7Z14_13415 [Anaerolineae bacterium]|nr:hypothetical protein [Phycisphaerae bacterium]
MMRYASFLLVVFAVACPLRGSGPLAEAVREYFNATTPEGRKSAVAETASTAIDGAQLSAALHRAVNFESYKSGEQTVAIQLEDGSTRTVFVRVPNNYSPQRAWPIILAYHGTGGGGHDLIEPIVRLLGNEAEDFLIAGVDQYQPNNVDSKRSWRPEYRLVFQDLKRHFNIDSDRIYTTGFSGGGYVAWSMAIFYGDEIAATIPVASAFDAAPEIPGMWEMLLPNVSNTPVLNVWGANDRLQVLGIDLTTPQGTNHELNQKLIPIAKMMNLPITSFCVKGGGHTFEPPRKQTLEMLKKKREQYPREVKKRFRYLNQARAYWLEGLAWDGDQWGLGPRELPDKQGQTRERAIAEMLEQTLGSLHGKIDRQDITINSSHLGELAVWFGEGMIDWTKPIRVTANGKVVFEGPIERDVRVALSQAARTRDFERLRWAGLKISKDGSARLIDPDKDELPAVVWEKPH